MPTIPKPGTIKISIKINAIPASRKITSVISAKPTKKWEPKNNAKHVNPIIPGKPNPGDLISINKPSIPKLINKGATTGLVRKRTNLSDHDSLVFISSTLISFYHFGIEQGFIKESLVCDLNNENKSLKDLLYIHERDTAIRTLSAG